jgi:transposase-like protein
MNFFTNLHNLDKYFTDEKTCIKYLEHVRWSDKPACTTCGSTKFYVVKNRKHYKCADCKKFFNVLSGTLFENTKISLIIWFKAIYIATSHKKGISSCQLAKDLGVTQKTAWFVLSRIRHLASERVPFMLSGVCEVDETYVGGKIKNKHNSFKKKLRLSNQDTNFDNKTMVFGIIERGSGKVFTKVVQSTTIAELIPLIQKNVKKNTVMYSDELSAYAALTKLGYRHETVQHAIKEYVRGAVHTNSIEGYWSNLKRGIIGVYHHVSPKHLNKYCDEFSFRYNTREITEVERFRKALRKCDDTRLKYTTLTAPVIPPAPTMPVQTL